MTDDYDDQRREILSQIESDVADFIASLDQDTPSGVPPPPKIEITDVSAQPVDIELLKFGGQQTGVTPGPGGPLPADEPGACCVGTDCTIETPADCDGLGGVFQGSGTTCDPNPCSTTGACCVGDTCTVETADDCTGLGGTYIGDDTTCDPDPCVDGACCNCGDCSTRTEAECLALGHEFHPGECVASFCCQTPYSCCQLCDGENNCAGTAGFISDTGCYCTLVETADDFCHVDRPDAGEGAYYERWLTFQYTTVYGWIPFGGGCTFGIVSSTCDYCNLFRHFTDGSETNCDCCTESCSAGFCGDAGGIDCGCTWVDISDTEKECASTGGPTPAPANATCYAYDHQYLSGNCA